MTIRGYLTTTATTGTHTVIRDAYQQGRQVTLQVDVGQNAAPVTGDPRFSGEYIIESYQRYRHKMAKFESALTI